MNETPDIELDEDDVRALRCPNCRERIPIGPVDTDEEQPDLSQEEKADRVREACGVLIEEFVPESLQRVARGRVDRLSDEDAASAGETLLELLLDPGDAA